MTVPASSDAENPTRRPKRIQRKRTKGWRMPEGAMYVGRPSRWGNPFIVGEPFRVIVEPGIPTTGVIRNRAHAVELFRGYMGWHPELRARVQGELSGRDLACWCPLDQPCHADVLLRIANEVA